MTADPRLILPLDLPSVAEARQMVETLGDAVSFYKIGLELLATDGMALARELKTQGKSVFLDWKLHDIGATVERSAAVLAGAGCDLLTVHAEPQVMRAAVKAKGGSDLKILAVTVLTSLTDADLIEMGYAFSRPRPGRATDPPSGGSAGSTASFPRRRRPPRPARSPARTSWW
jgi:orotidine-5'-phosphate decarboxylase